MLLMATSTLSSNLAFLSISKAVLLLLLFVFSSSATLSSFDRDFSITWAPERVKILDQGRQLQLSLDNTSGSGFASKNKYLFGNIDMQIKLVPGNSAGTVTAYYLFSESEQHDELDPEFLENVSGQPYILQTNVFASGKGEREQRLFLWFDPTQDFHTYSVIWTPPHILFLVDGIPIRRYANKESLGVAFLNNQAMGVYSSLWTGDSWATRGGLDKIDWTQAPFLASYRNFSASTACVVTTNLNNCKQLWAHSNFNSNSDSDKQLEQEQQQSLDWVKKNFIIYDYCTDAQRNPTPPPECAFN
uniref:Xyloglucan endotransglucosylase/hydrolase n=1 Tax=Equisetum fluviatile TaxID=231680 RepID=A0A7D5BS23_EQUFL|nr:xyloglucan endo-transglycoylase/hydrolase A [Equisetum fluviatile]